MIIGIDLGTTNSAAAIWQDGKALLVPNSVGDLSTPARFLNPPPSLWTNA